LLGEGVGEYMVKSKGHNVLALIILLLLVLISGCGKQSEIMEPNATIPVTRVITDMAGRNVMIPDKVNRVAAIEVLGYEKMFLLGESDKLVSMLLTNPPWMLQTNPKVQQISKMTGEINVEDILNQKVDVVFSRYDEKKIEQLTTLGIPVLVSQPVASSFANTASYIEKIKESVRLFGKVMGSEAEQKAEMWCAYYDEKVKYVTARTSQIPENRRVKVYCVRGPDALTTQGVNSHTFCFGELAGANMFMKNSGLEGKGPASMEEVVKWNPDVIFVGRQYSTDLVLKDARWQNIKAVKEGKVYVIPDGVFYWDGSTEGVLMMEYMAKVLYPDLFTDLDMMTQLKEYYVKFYHYNLTDVEANKILNGLSPDGSRVNSMNN